MKRFWISFFGLHLSNALIMGSLWQIEVATGFCDDLFWFPFFIFSVNKWWARDFWYLINGLAWILGVLSSAAFVVELRRLVR